MKRFIKKCFIGCKMINFNHQFKTTKYQNKWQYEIDNIDTNIRYVYKNEKDLSVLLRNYKKVFKITPAKLKTLKADDENIKLIVWIALKYTSITPNTLISELNIDKNDIDKILANNDNIFSKEIDKFFKPLKQDYLLNVKATLLMQEEFESFIK